MASEPEHPAKKESAPKEKRESGTDNRRTSAAALIDAFAKQYQADRQEGSRREGHRIFREWLTIFGLFLAAVIAFFQWRELRSTDHNISEQARIASEQFKVMQDQLVEMRGTSTQTDKLIDANQKLAETSIKQAAAAEVSASAAKSAVEISDRTAEWQLRAYINVEKIVVYWKDGVARAEVSIRNAGQTPATAIVFRGIFATGDDISQPGKLPASFGNFPANLMLGDEDPSKVTKILGQGREDSFVLRTSFAPVTGQKKTKVRFPSRLFVIGAIYYKDIFGKPRYTRFCLNYANPNYGTYCTQHNDVS